MDFLGTGTPAMWGGFLAFVLAMLALDLGVFNRKAHTPSFREALGWSAVWVALALAFCGGVRWFLGPHEASTFLTGYVVEKALAVDNLFVFVAVFTGFAVPAAQQHRVLLWGVLGALVMRAAFIFAGGALIERFDWMLYLFGGFLVLTGLKMFTQGDAHGDVKDNRLYQLVRRVVPATDTYRGGAFFVVEQGRRLATPLFFALVVIEAADLVFAVDSIPAIFGITTDPFIVFTSNVFAILGLRSMYFLLADIVPRFVYLKYGLSLVLVFVGCKMLLLDLLHIPVAVSLGVIVALVAGAIVLSLRATREVEAV